MRIALVAHTNSPWTRHYGRELDARGHVVRILSFHPAAIPGLDCIPVGSGARKGAYLGGLLRVRRELRAFRPDVVFAPYLSSNGLVAALTWRGPLVVSARGGDVLRQAGRLPAPPTLHRGMMRFVCGRARVVHAVSQELRDALVGMGVAPERIETFPIGVDTARFRPGVRSPGEGPAALVCTRRQEPVYENHVVIDALARLRERGTRFVCTMVGGGPLLEERRAQAARLGLSEHVRFAGQVEHDALPALLAGSDLYLSASSSDGTSSSLLEALASGCHPVVTRIPANEAWIRDGETGDLFRVGDAADLAGRIASALSDPERRRRASAANRALVCERGDLQRNLDRLEALLGAAAAGGPAAAVGRRMAASP